MQKRSVLLSHRNSSKFLGLKRQPGEQPTKEAMSLLPSPAQSQETAPEIDSSETARTPTPAEEPIGDAASGSEPLEDSDQQGDETLVEAAIRVTNNSLRKGVAIAATSPA